MLQLIIIYQQFVYEHEGLLHYCPAALEPLSILPLADASPSPALQNLQPTCRHILVTSTSPLGHVCVILPCTNGYYPTYLGPGAALSTPGTTLTPGVRVTVGALLADSLQQLSVFPFHHLSIFPLSIHHLSVCHLSSYHLSVHHLSLSV